MSTSCRRRSSSPGTARSNSMALLVYALLAFSSITALVLKMLRFGSRKRETTPTTARRSSPLPPDSPPPPDGEHFREIAHGLRVLARRCRYPGARTELLQLAASFDRRADHFDARQSPLSNLDPSAG